MSWLPRPGQRGRVALRLLRRLLTLVIVLGVFGAIASAGLLLTSPAVGNASALARALTRAHRAPFPGPSVPRQFSASLIATEDHRFYSEPGIDPIAIIRVIAGTLAGQPDQGGATLYQQLARMLYSSRRPGVAAEAQQIALGVKLAFSYPKAAILRMYSEVVYFGHGYYGLEQASCGYFGIPPSRLSWPQAALLAGIVPAPSDYNPITNFRIARAREAHVLSRLAATGVLTTAQAAQAFRQPLHVRRAGRTECGAG